MELINDFDKLCTQIFYYNNKFQFPFDSIKHDGQFQKILENGNYPLLESKMKNLIEMINQNHDLIFEDTKNLWDQI